MKGTLEHGVNGWDQRLDEVVQEMAKADGREDGEDCLRGFLRRR
jgi:hypothetical protein